MLTVEFYPAVVSFVSSDQYDSVFCQNSLKFDDSNNGDSTDDKEEDEECEPKSAVSKKR